MEKMDENKQVENGNMVKESKIIHTMNTQLEELDDDEFQLPPVSEMPTLESILNEEDDPGSVSDTDMNLLAPNTNSSNSVLGEGGDTASVHSKASSDSKSRTSSDKMNKFKREAPSKYHGSVLRHVALKGIATQLISANERVGAGLPTSMAVGTVICIGTSHGLILVFDPSQALKCCLGSTQQGEQYGAVSALSLNQESSRLLAGYSKGHVCLFDVINSKILQHIPDAHTPFTAVLHIKWTDCPGLALLSDSGGSVFEISIKRLMGLNSNESRCIFSGSRGEVFTIEPLLMGQFLTLPPIVDTVIVAMATMSKVIVVSLRPHLKVYFSHPLESSSVILPLLAWQFVIIQMPNGSKVIDPVLAFGRDSTLFFYQLTHGSQDELTFLFLQRVDVNYSLQAVAWLNSRTLAVMDTREKLHVIDMKSQEELDTVDLARLGLVYASSQFKGLATGGNVSKAMAAAGERACYHSMVNFGSQILLLGTKSFQVVTMRSWLERLEHMCRCGNVGDALHLALDILKDRAQGVVGLTHKKERRRHLLRGRIKELLDLYLEQAKETCPENASKNKLRQFYQMVVPHSVKIAVEANFHDFLFGKIWDTFSEDSISRGIYLESIEPYILDDQIPDISPAITQRFLSHYEVEGKLDALEACIVHLSITSLDLHQTMTLCRGSALYDALFYIYTRGMNDYITPLEELIKILKFSLLSGSPETILGNKILVYISCCLAGRAYPHGNIDSGILKLVKHDVFKCITCLHTKDVKEEEGELAYPILRILLQFDTREFLNVLAIAFEEDEFTSELGMIQRQRVVDILLQIMVDDDEFNAVQLGSLFTFIARQMSKQSGSLALNKNLFEQVLNHLTDPEADGYHEERQTALLELIQEGGLIHFQEAQLLQRAKKAQFYRVLEYIHERNEDYGSILECYIYDKMRRHQAFIYIKTVLSSPHFTNDNKTQVINQISSHIKALLRIDAAYLAQLFLSVEVLNPLILRIAEDLLEDKELLYDYLQALFAAKSNHLNSRSQKDNDINVDNDDLDENIFMELQEKYISLMAELYPSQVYHFLQGTDNYRVDSVLEICQRHNLEESTAFLLEKNGDFPGAHKIHMDLLNIVIDEFNSDVQRSSVLSLLDEVRAQVTKVMKLCRLGSVNIEESCRRQLWFPLLDVLLKLQPRFTAENNHLEEMRGIIGLVVNNMMAHISLPSILERIIQDPCYTDCNFGQIKHLLKDMVERYTYEETLYTSIVSIIRKDQLFHLARMKDERSAPLRVQSTVCSICRSRYHGGGNAIAHSCGHSYHLECGNDNVACIVCSGSFKTGGTSTNATPPSLLDAGAEVQMALDDIQLDGLKRMSLLDSSAARLRYEEDTFHAPDGRPETEERFLSSDFALKLAPTSLPSKFGDDV